MEYDLIVHSNEGPEMAIEGVVTDSCNNIPIEEVSIKTTGNASIGTTDANINTYDHTDLTCSTTYYYRIRVTNEACDSDYTDVVNASTSACPISSTTTTTVPPTVSVIPTDSLQCSACFKSAR